MRFGQVGSDGGKEKAVDWWCRVNRVRSGRSTGTSTSEAVAVAWHSHRL